MRPNDAALQQKLLKVPGRTTTNFPVPEVHPSRQHKLAVAKKIRELRPHTVIIPYWEARHPDHYHASALAYEGCFLAGLKQLPLEGEPYRPFKILYCTSFEGMPPTFIVDITKQYETPPPPILAYPSQSLPAHSK